MARVPGPSPFYNLVLCRLEAQALNVEPGTPRVSLECATATAHLAWANLGLSQTYRVASRLSRSSGFALITFVSVHCN